MNKAPYQASLPTSRRKRTLPEPEAALHANTLHEAIISRHVEQRSR